MFKQIAGYKLEVAQFGDGGPGTITVFRTPDAAYDIWQKTDAGAILIVGGPRTINEMRRLWQLSRPKIQELFPISSSTHNKIKQWLLSLPR